MAGRRSQWRRGLWVALRSVLALVPVIGIFFESWESAERRTREFQARSKVPLPYVDPPGRRNPVLDEWFDERRIP